MDAKTQTPTNGTQAAPTQAAQAPAAQPQKEALALAIKQKTEADKLGRWLEEKRAWFASVLPKHLTADRLIRIALFARSRNPDLLKCSPESLLRAVMECAEMGLEPTGASGGAWLIPFWNKKTGKFEATCIPDWRGYIRLALQSGKVQAVEARCAYKNDELFEIEEGCHADIRHKPLVEGDRGPLVAVYCVATLKSGAKLFEWMTKAQVDRIRSLSPGANSDAWTNHYEEQARKTVVRRAQKYWPKSKRLEVAAALDAALDDGTPGVVVDSTAIETFLPDDVIAPPAPPSLSAQAGLPQTVEGESSPVQVAASAPDSPPVPPANADGAPGQGVDPIQAEVQAILKEIAATKTKKEAHALNDRIFALPPTERAEVLRFYESHSKKLAAR